VSEADDLIELSKDWRCTGAEVKAFRKLAEFIRENESLRADLAAARAEIEELKRGKSCALCGQPPNVCMDCARRNSVDYFKPRDPSAEQEKS